MPSLRLTKCGIMQPKRCSKTKHEILFPWVGAGDKAYIKYMLKEWGVPVHDDRRLFEMLALECFQAGLSWACILKRRSAFRRAFANWRLSAIAAYDANDRSRLMKDSSIIRNARKIDAVISNASAALELQREFGSLDAYFWSFVNGRPVIRNRHCKRWDELPTQSEESKRMANDLKAHGFRFVGPIGCYAFMQAAGLVNDRIFELKAKQRPAHGTGRCSR